MCTVLLYGEIIVFIRLIIIPVAFHIPCRIGDIAERQLHILCSCESQCGRFCGLEIGVLASTLYGKFPLVTADGNTLAIGKEILKYRLFASVTVIFTLSPFTENIPPALSQPSQATV